MRVYEFSKQYGIPTKELLELLEGAGYNIHSHMSVLVPEALEFLHKKYAKTTQNVVKESKKVDEPIAKTKPEAPHKEIPKNKIQQAPVKPTEPKETLLQKEAAISTQTVSTKQEKSLPFKEAVQPHEEVIEHQQSLILESMSVGTFAENTHKPISDVILTLLKWGIVAAKNQLLTEDIVARLAKHYEIEVVAKSKEKSEEDKEISRAHVEGQSVRLPIVVVLGHVDHGKTTLLDFIRKTRVAAREKGGITQHLGAYEANTPHGNIVFIDTPGHEAFSKMRMRGIKVADVVVLVVAADDSVMPQTIEAIKQAKSMHVPIIVAVNKIDKVDAQRLDVVKRDLANNDLLPEEWGGEVIVAPISAKTGQGVDQLLDLIALQSQIMELKADITGPAQGYVLESKLEKGRGPVATLLCQHGVIAVGDYFVCGTTSGRVSSLVDSHGQRIQSAGPSIPVLVAGFSELPNAGDFFAVVSVVDYKKASKTKATEYKPAGMAFVKTEGINILIKTDTNSSKEAILGSLHKLSKKFEKKFNIVRSGIGDISESDVEFAATTGAAIYALHVKAEPNAMSLAQKQTVAVHFYDIIYKLLEALEAVAEGAKEIKKIKSKIGEAIVRQVFNIKGLGVIAGSYVSDGRFSKDGVVTILRGNKKIGEGPIKSLQRDKKPVKEVHSGYECGFLVQGFEDWAVDDRVECFLEIPETAAKK